MLSRLKHILNQLDATSRLFYGFAGITLFCLFTGVAMDVYPLVLAPAVILLAFLTVVDFKSVFFLLLFCIPLSTEIVLPNGLGTDLPTEPLIVGLMGVYLLYILAKGKSLNLSILRHPLTLLLLLHVGWILITTLTSAQAVVSIKFLLAKIWYLITFYFLAAMLLKEQQDYKRFVWIILIPLSCTILITLIRFKGYEFSFEYVHKVLHPFYRNHVAYAAIMVTFFPFLWLAWRWQESRSWIWWGLIGVIVLFLVGIQLSYTRAAYGALLIAIGAYFVIQFRFTRYVLAFGLAAAIGLVAYLTTNNKYLEYAPDYETTITHTNFDNLLEATYQMEDISTMERVYRWVAASFMIKERPMFGFGPGNFYFFYKSYTVRSFKTYVSDNPEGSGIHSYYIMLMVEQGIPGLLLFLLVICYALLRGEQIFHRLPDLKDRQIIMAAMLSLIIILVLLLINDLVETDKIGPFFFMNLAIIVNMDLKIMFNVR